jgi:hypothetical protein
MGQVASVKVFEIMMMRHLEEDNDCYDFVHRHATKVQTLRQ